MSTRDQPPAYTFTVAAQSPGDSSEDNDEGEKIECRSFLGSVALNVVFPDPAP
jgi:hypothetical protein